MIRKFFETEGAKLRKMNFRDKRQYIWEYYKLHIILTCIVIFVIGYMINHLVINPPIRSYIYISWQADFVHTDTLDALGVALNPIVENYERYEVHVRSYVLTGDPQMDQALITRFQALIHVGDLHAIVILGEHDVIANAQVGLIMPVDGMMEELYMLNPALHDYIQTRVLPITFTDLNEREQTEMMAVSLQDAPLFAELGINSDELYLSVVVTGDANYKLAKALEIIFEGTLVYGE